MRWLYSSLLTLWFVLFGLLAIFLSKDMTHLRRTYEKLEGAASELNERALEIRNEVTRSQLEAGQMGFLEGLVNLLPQEKGFVRTQKAMAGEVELLRRKVGRRLRDELHIVVDSRANKLYLKRGLTLLWAADCSVGKGGILIDRRTGRRWEFVTPQGRFEVRNKLEKPLWVKPDWAFVEAGEAVPPPGDAARKVEGELGGYVLNLGNGYLIHGTKNETTLGRPASHGCVRLGAENLKMLYETVPVGTPVYIY
jgi:L,D-transpeptidase ErfK/SrfK